MHGRLRYLFPLSATSSPFPFSRSFLFHSYLLLFLTLASNSERKDSCVSTLSLLSSSYHTLFFLAAVHPFFRCVLVRLQSVPTRHGMCVYLVGADPEICVSTCPPFGTQIYRCSFSSSPLFPCPIRFILQTLSHTSGGSQSLLSDGPSPRASNTPNRKYAEKYIQKFMRKQRKEVNDDDGELARRIEGQNQSSALIVAKIAEHLVPTKKKPPRDVLHASVVGEIWEGVLFVGGHKSSSLRSVRPLSGLVCCLCVATVAVGP